MRSFSSFRTYINGILPTVLVLIAAALAMGQSTGSSEDASANPVYRRIERARALAAVHQLPAAAAELENIRASGNDVTLRNVATLMLLGIYLEDGNYGRSQALLDETFQTRAAQKDESIRTYFAAAGQTVNGIRSHLARYRGYGINPSDAGLPVEANTDLERVRGLLERIVAQAREISKEQGRAYEAFALLEDVLGIRLSLSRNDDERAKWQTDYLSAREKMASMQSPSLGRSQALDAVTNRIPNPFASKPAPTSEQTAPETATAAPAAAATTTTAEPQVVSAGSLSGRETKRVTPSYPPGAKTHNVTGTVRVFAIVDENGKVWVTNSEGPTMLRTAAEAAARSWVFPPSTFNGKPVRIVGYLDFDFKL
ncbi:MAG TPA: energy transducer TonB [Pyrinomonadaceae bacterium]|nr:energy transducer TonB [Pyrinomonadaceae bacterium]